MRGSRIIAIALGVVLLATVLPALAISEETTFEEFVVTDAPGPDTQVEFWGDLVVWRHMDDDMEFDDLTEADLTAASVCGSGEVWAKDLSTGKMYQLSDNEDIQDNNPSVYGDLVVWSEEGTAVVAFDMSTSTTRTLASAEDSRTDLCNPFIWGNQVVWVENHWSMYGPGYDNLMGYNLNTSKLTTLVAGDTDFWISSPELYGKKVVYERHNQDFPGGSSIWVYDMGTDTEEQVSDLVGGLSPAGIGSPSIWGDKVVWYQWEDVKDSMSGDIYMHDLTTGQTKLICADTARECVDIGGEFIVWSDNRNCTNTDDPRMSASSVPGDDCECCDTDGDADLMAGIEGAETPMRDIYGYNISTGDEFPICLEMGCQKRPRVYGNTVVWMDNRTGTYPDIWGTRLDTQYDTVAGDDRFETAVELSREAFPDGCDTVIVATGYNWPDALSAASLAGVVNGPVLISYPQRLPAVVAAEIERLGAENAYIIGGPAAISPSVEVDLNVALDGDVVRLAGSERCGTANRVAEEVVDLLGPDYDGTSILVTSMNFPDAVAAAPIAAAAKRPMFLAGADGISTETRSTMAALGVQESTLLGGYAAIPVAVENALEASLPGDAVVRIGGETRYHTAANVAQYGVDTLGLGWSGLALATGLDFPDALTGGVTQGLAGSTVLLTPSYDLHEAPKAKIVANADIIYSMKYFGGLNAISQVVRDEAEALLVK